MESIKLAAVVALLGGLCGGALAQTAATPVAATKAAADVKWSTESLIGDLLDYEPSKAVLVKHLPELTQDGQIEMVRGLTFRSLQQFSPDVLTDVLLAKIDADLAKLPARAAVPAAPK